MTKFIDDNNYDNDDNTSDIGADHHHGGNEGIPMYTKPTSTVGRSILDGIHWYVIKS